MASFNFSAKNIINAKTCSKSLQKNLGEILVSGLAVATILEKDEKTGEATEKEVGYIADTEGNIFGTISATAIEAICDIIPYLDENKTEVENGVKIFVEEKESINKRKFLTITLM